MNHVKKGRMMSIFSGILEQGLIYAVLGLGIYISFIVLNIPDLTVDGTFPFGSALSAWFILMGFPPPLALLGCFLGGMIAGTITGIIHVRFHIIDFIAGIITATGLYTINLLVAGKANVALFNNPSIFNQGLFQTWFGPFTGPWRTSLILFPWILLIKILLDLFFSTKAGFLLKASGDNPMLVKTMGKDPGQSKIFGLALANGLVALSGGLLCQQQRFFEISVGTGSMMIGLASVVIGMKIFERLPSIQDTTKVIIGSIIYKAIIAIALALGLPSQMMKLMTAVLFFLILVLSHTGGLIRTRTSGQKGDRTNA